MSKRFDLYTRTNQVILDGCAFAISFVAAYWIGSPDRSAGLRFGPLLLWLPILVSARLAIHWARGIYRQIWRFVSFGDALEILKSIGLVSAALAGLNLLYPRHHALALWVRLPIGVVVLEGMAALTLTMGVRALRRILYIEQKRRSAAAGNEPPKRVLLYGAGRAGIMLLRELETNRAYDVIGFVDDDQLKIGSMVCSTRVLGRGDDLAALVQRYHVDEILICMATAQAETLGRVYSQCRRTNVPARIIPSMQELLTGKAPSVELLLSSAGGGFEASGSSGSSNVVSRGTSPELAKAKRVLVIGGAGYIGSTLVRALLARGYRVRVLDSLLYGDAGIRPLLERPDFELIEGDSRDVEAVVRACRDTHAVMHLGAIVGDAACALEPSRTVEINLAATKMIADICKGYGVSRFLFASTCSVYGASDHLVDEESPRNPVSLYASTKLDSEAIILNASSDHFHPTILRLATAFGSSHRLRFDLVVNLLVIKALTERRITLHGGNQWRPFIHVHDIARAFILSMESSLEKVSQQIFNAGADDLTYTIASLGAIIRECIPSVKVEFLPETDKRNYRVSFVKIRGRLGFVCEKHIEDAVREIRQLYEARRIGDYRDSQYSNHEFLKSQLAEDDSFARAKDIPIAATLKSLTEISGGLRKSQSA